MTDKPLASTSLTTEQTARSRILRRLRRAETIYVAALILFAVLAASAYFNSYFGWDLRAARALQSLPGLLALMHIVSLPGNYITPHVLTAITIIVLLCFRLRHEAYGLLFSAAGSAILNSLLKILIARPRPTADLVSIHAVTGSRSFPSGHVTFYVCYFGFLFFVAYALLPRGSFARRVTLILTALPVLLVGLSRVYLGAHWPSDTLGAYLWSGVWLALSLDFYRRRKQSAKNTDR